MLRNLFFWIVFLLFPSFLYSVHAQSVPAPKEHFGFAIGDDYLLANYTQTEAYFKKVAEASNRTKLVDIGLTEEGRHQYMLIVSSPQNIQNLVRYKEIAQQLARAENLTDEQARQLAGEGKAIVWIDGGLHANEVVGAHQLIESVYQFTSRQDPETLRILDHSIILFAHANPDGQEIMSDWYMREKDPQKRKQNIPRLYQKYIGHDNNRDFFMNNMKESQNISRQQYIEWMPQIIYNHHQAGPAGTVVAGPPYRDPFNYVYDPLLITFLDGIGAAMNSRLNLENKPGYTQRGGSVYSTWWNGGLRTTAYFHNMIGILTEIIGNPTPMEVPLVLNRLVPSSANPFPIMPQKWHFRQSIDYSVSLNYAVLNHAVNQKQELLYGIYRMGKNAIEKGRRDTWTLSPKYLEQINTAYKNDPKIKTRANANAPTPADSILERHYVKTVKDPNRRDARGYILSAAQPDFPTAAKFINALLYSGILVHKATTDFIVQGKKYPAGSFVVKTDQAFRPHVLDMFEPQDHPNDFQYPGGPPVAPYDAAGWTLAFEMGVHFDRILNEFTGPFQRIPYGELQRPKGQLKGGNAGYIIPSEINNAFVAVNGLLQAGVAIYRISAAGKDKTAGAFFVPAGNKAKSLLTKYASEYGINTIGAGKKPKGLVQVKPLRIALWDIYGGSINSGWMRWILEQYQFPFQIIYPQEINTTDLKKKYDVIVLPGGAIPAVGTRGSTGSNGQPKAADIPTEFRDRLGRLTADTSITQLKKFMQAGGQIVAIGSSTNLAYQLDLPVKNALVEMNNGQEQPLAGGKYYIPGSILEVAVDAGQPAAWGMPTRADVYFDASPVFKVAPDALTSGKIKPILWFASDKPLRSGWAWGQSYLQNGIAAFEAPVGAGKLYAFGPEITFRAQTHGTFKLLFNQLYKTGYN